MRFLISRLSSLGDVVCTLPAASALKLGFPGSEVTWIVDRRFADVVRCCPAVDTVVEARMAYRKSEWPELEGSFEVAFDLQGLLKSALPIALSKAGRKLGYHWQREGSHLFSRAVLPDPTSFHIVDQYVDVVRAAGGVADRAEFNLEPPAEELQEVRKLLAAQGIRRFLVLNPSAGWVSKRWPEKICARFVDLVQESGVRVLLIGGQRAEDLEIARSISAACKEAPALWTGKTTLSELIAVLTQCAVHVGGDTGSTHIAAALGRPCVGLYSITDPRRSCPYGQIDRCLRDRVSLSEIAPEAVFEIAKESWA